MPTRLNKTSIGVSEQVKNLLNNYRGDTESWDELISRMVRWIEAKNKESLPQPDLPI